MPQQKKPVDSKADSPPTASTALTIAAQTLGPQQQLFNKLLHKIEQQSAQLQNLKALANAHAAECSAKLAPLRQQVHAQQEKLVLFLDQRLQVRKGLSQSMCGDITDLICMLLDELYAAGDLSAALQELADRYDDAEADAQDGLDEASASELNRAMAQMMGIELDAEESLSDEAMMQALIRKLQADDETALHAHEARQAKRKQSAKQKKAAQQELDAHSALRSIYRKLASALHPDRETDSAERTRKTALMVRVNAANDRKDLLALLRLQLEIDQIDPASVASMADDKLRSFNRMLQNQLKDLQTEYGHVLMQVRSAFDLGYGDVTPKALAGGLRFQTQRLQDMLENLQRDIVAIQDDKALKKWIKLQIAIIDDPDHF